MSPAPHPTPAAGSARRFVGWLVAERLLRGVLAFAVTGVVARHLGPAGYGELNTALALAAVLMPLANLGLDALVMRDLVATPAQAGAVLGTAAGLRLIAGGICALGLGTWAWLAGAPVGAALLVPSTLMLLWQAGEAADAWFRRQTQSRTTVLVRSGVVLTGAGAKVALAAAGAGPVAFAWVFSAESLAFGLALLLAQRTAAGPTGRWRWDAARATGWLRTGWGFVLGMALASVAFRFDQLAVQHMLGNDAAGKYFAVVRLMEIPFFFAATATTALLPALAEAQRDEPHALRRLELSFSAASAVGWTTALGATLLGPWVLPLVFGVEYSAAVPALIILGWAQLALLPEMVQTQFLALRGVSATQATLSAATLGGIVAGCVLLVPRFGVTGAALAFLGAHVLSRLVLPCWLPALRPCFRPQWRALSLPLRPREWAALWKEFA